jgi:hypothetical protein
MTSRSKRHVAALILGAASVICFTSSHATMITADFSGQVNHNGGHFDPGTGAFDNFGLDVAEGDALSGQFGYDDTTGTLSFFTALLGGESFTATNLRMGAQLFDGFTTWFYVMGEIGNGLYMSIGLTAGAPVFTQAPPSFLDSSEWTTVGFKVSDTQRLPIENGVAEDGAIRAQSRTSFSLRTVPAPGMLGLLGLALLIGGGVQMRARFSR